MRVISTPTELQIRFRPDEVDGFINLVLDAKYTPFRKELLEQMKRECLL